MASCCRGRVKTKTLTVMHNNTTSSPVPAPRPGPTVNDDDDEAVYAEDCYYYFDAADSLNSCLKKLCRVLESVMMSIMIMSIMMMMVEIPSRKNSLRRFIQKLTTVVMIKLILSQKLVLQTIMTADEEDDDDELEANMQSVKPFRELAHPTE